MIPPRHGIRSRMQMHGVCLWGEGMPALPLLRANSSGKLRQGAARQLAGEV